MSEVRFGIHPNGPTLLTSRRTLTKCTGEDPKHTLGGGLPYALGPTLSCLTKITTSVQTLSP